MSNTGTSRRLRAMAVMGHNVITVVGHLHTTWHQADTVLVLSRIRSGIFFGDVRDELALDVARVYRHLCALPGHDPGTSEMALAAGWMGPSAWDDPDADEQPLVDEPDDWDALGIVGEYVDEIAVRRALVEKDARHLSRAERLEALRRIGGQELTPGTVAHQLGLSSNVARSLQKRLEDMELKALAVSMAS